MNNLVGIILKKAVYEISKEISYRQGMVDGIAAGSIEGYGDENIQYQLGVVAGLKKSLEILKSIGQGGGKTKKPMKDEETIKSCEKCRFWQGGSGENPCYDCKHFDENNTRDFWAKND